MKKTNLMLAVVAIAAVALILAGCGRDMMQSDNANVSNANSSGDMMNGMMNNPQQHEMMMQMMMNSAEHRKAMIEMMRRNPQMREQMSQIINEADKPAAK